MPLKITPTDTAHTETIRKPRWSSALLRYLNEDERVLMGVDLVVSNKDKDQLVEKPDGT
jgi:hypothetical protein